MNTSQFSFCGISDIITSSHDKLIHITGELQKYLITIGKDLEQHAVAHFKLWMQTCHSFTYWNRQSYVQRQFRSFTEI